MMIVLTLAAFFIVALLDFVPLVRYKQTGHAILFGTIFILTLTLSLLMISDVKIPSMYILIKQIIELVGLHY